MGIRIIGLAGVVFSVIVGCSTSHNLPERTKFTHLDSLTDTYLSLQDSVLQSWNRVLKIESDRSKSLHEMIAQIANHGLDAAQLESLTNQLNQLEKIRFSPSTVSNPHVVSEYDHACESLWTQLWQLAKGNESLSSSPAMQAQVQWINQMKNVTWQHRAYYDSLASQFNRFVEANRAALKEIERNGELESKPLFHVQSTDK